MIRNIVFDFGKVLVDYDFKGLVHEFFQTSDRPEDESLRAEKDFLALVSDPEFVDRCDLEPVPFPEIVRDMQRRYPHYEREFALFLSRYQEFVTGEVPGMRQLISRLRAEGYRLYGLTNWCSEIHGVIAHWDILQLLDGRVISSEERLIKPDCAIYECLMERYGLRADECLFVDDKQPNVDGARRAGMQAVRFTTAAQLEQDLAQLL